MIERLRKLFARPEEFRQENQQFDPLQFCVAVLLAEIVRADHEQKEVEVDEMRCQLAAEFLRPDQPARKSTQTPGADNPTRPAV